jgi:ribose transport system substrate-binding protein
MRSIRNRKTLAVLATAAILLSGGAAKAEDPTLTLHKQSDALFKGKTLAFLPQTLGSPAFDTWNYVLRHEAEALGMKYVVKDAGWNPTALTQALEGLIADKPDILVVNPPNVQLLSRQVKKAMDNGIYTITIGLAGTQPADAHVGGDWIALAEDTAADMIKECGAGSGKSGKVAILQGMVTSAQNISMFNVLTEAFKKDPTIKVVSTQATDWDQQKAFDITSSVLQQNPDLCAAFVPYDVTALGIGQAVKKAGLSGKVLVYTNGGGYQVACEAVRDGLFDRYWDWDAWGEGRSVMGVARTLMTLKVKPGSHPSIPAFSSWQRVTKDNLASARCSSIPPS